MVWGQGTGVGSGHWLLSGSPGQLFPAMDGGLVPLPGSPRWLLLSSWWQGGSRSQGRHRVLAGMCLQGCRSTPGLQEGIWGKRAPAAAPGQAGAQAAAPRQDIRSELQAPRGRDSPAEPRVAVEPYMSPSRLGQGYQGFPDDTLRGFPGKEGYQPSPVTPEVIRSGFSRGTLGDGAGEMAKPPHAGTPHRGVVSLHPCEGGSAMPPRCGRRS